MNPAITWNALKTPDIKILISLDNNNALAEDENLRVIIDAEEQTLLVYARKQSEKERNIIKQLKEDNPKIENVFVNKNHITYYGCTVPHMLIADIIGGDTKNKINALNRAFPKLESIAKDFVLWDKTTKAYFIPEDEERLEEIYKNPLAIKVDENGKLHLPKPLKTIDYCIYSLFQKQFDYIIKEFENVVRYNVEYWLDNIK